MTAERTESEVDARLVQRARRGDDTAFADLMRRHDAALRRLAFHLLDDRDAMDDVLQEVYVKAHRALPGFRSDATLRTWLHRVAYNACMDELRRRRGRIHAPLTEALERPDPAADPVEALGERSALAAALAALPPGERAAVLLVDAAGFDYAAAAEVLGVPAGTVASRLSRARGALRRALETTPDREEDRR
jgi:RNA polymerase sigma-70 factor (ECF subfamily)